MNNSRTRGKYPFLHDDATALARHANVSVLVHIADQVECGKIAAMTETPKRRFWRFHLLTALLLMVISGVFLGANVRAPRVVRIHPRNSSMHYYDLDEKWSIGMTEAGCRQR